MYIFPLRLSNILQSKIDLTGKWSVFRRFRSVSPTQRKNSTNISLQRNISKPRIFYKKVETDLYYVYFTTLEVTYL